MKEHERQQTARLRLFGIQRDEGARQPDGLRAELSAHQVRPGGRGVALVEEEVEDGEDPGCPLAEQFGGWHPEGDARVPDLVLGTDQPLGHGGLRHQEGTGDLGRGQPREAAQGEGDSRLDGERRVAAGEDQTQPIVGDATVVRLLVTGIGGGEQSPRVLEPGCLDDAAAQPVEGAIAGHRGQPGARSGRHSVPGPALHGLHEGILSTLLGQVPVARHADEAGDDAAPLRVERVGDGGVDPRVRLIRHSCRTTLVCLTRGWGRVAGDPDPHRRG